jgi:hypothetical protein
MNRNHCIAGIVMLLGSLLAIPARAPAASKNDKQPGATEKVIYSFTGGADGGVPVSDLTMDAAGNLYGTTEQGGTGTACN